MGNDLQSRHRRTVGITVSALLSALDVVLLSVGSLFESADLALAALASLSVVYAVIELGGCFPWMIWGAVSILSLLLPAKTPGLSFLLFFGYYPILKSFFERRNRVFCLVGKFLVFALASAGLTFLFSFFFPAEEDLLDKIGFWVFPLLLFLCFFVFDFALSRVISFYYKRFRGRFSLFKKP